MSLAPSDAIVHLTSEFLRDLATLIRRLIATELARRAEARVALAEKQYLLADHHETAAGARMEEYHDLANAAQKLMWPEQHRIDHRQGVVLADLAKQARTWRATIHADLTLGDVVAAADALGAELHVVLSPATAAHGHVGTRDRPAARRAKQIKKDRAT
jgi:hypothetical protein